MSGVFDNEKKAQEEMVRYCLSLSYTSQNLSGPIEKLWDDCYVGISNANTAIKYIPTTPGLEEAEREFDGTGQVVSCHELFPFGEILWRCSFNS